jgi:small-conductance mechanosensitive channel
MNPSDPGVTPTPPVEPAAPAAPAPDTTPSASEGVTPPASSEEQHVPYQRFQEVNTRAKEAEDRAAALEAELEAARNSAPKVPQNEDEDFLEPDVEDLIRRGAKKLGLVSREELQAQEMQRQVAQDVKTLESEYANTNVPYDHKAILDYAKENNLPITSKAALRAAYRDMNWDKIVEAERQRSIDAFKSGNSGGAERPGNSAPPADNQPQPQGIKARIRAARANNA